MNFFEVGHRAFYGAMGTLVEGCQNRKTNDFSEKNKNKMFYYLKIMMVIALR